jgi:hypothetical protein
MGRRNTILQLSGLSVLGRLLCGYALLDVQL